MKLDKDYVCKNNKNCSVTLETRNQCKYCRLQECFRVGMPKKCKKWNFPPMPSDWRARWLSGRVLDSGARGPGFEPHNRCVVLLK